MRLVFSSFVDPKPKYLQDAQRLVASLVSTAVVFDHKVILFSTQYGVKLMETMKWACNVEFISTPFFSEHVLCTNKIQAINIPIYIDFDVLILIDTDVIFCNSDITVLENKNYIQAKMADFKTFPRSRFETFSQVVGAKLPEENMQCTVSLEKSMLYCNTGVVCIPRRFLSDFRNDWIHYTNILLDNPDIIDGYEHFTEQAAFAFALLTDKYPYRLLSDEWNFPAHVSTHYVHLQRVNPSIIHYHNKIKANGLELADVGFHFADDKIKMFNWMFLNSKKEEFSFRKKIFIVGSMRSGTTQLAKILGESLNVVYCPFELKDIWSRIGGVPMASPKTMDRLCPYCDESRVYEYQRDVLEQEFFHVYCENMPSKHPNAFFLNKNPHFCNKILMLGSLYPDANYIWVYRSLLQVVVSLSKLFLDIFDRQRIFHYWPNKGIEPYRCWQVYHDTEISNGVLDRSRLFPGGDIKYLAEYWLESNISLKRAFDQLKLNAVKLNFNKLLSDLPENIKIIEKMLGGQLSFENSFTRELDPSRVVSWVKNWQPAFTPTLMDFVKENRLLIDEFENIGASDIYEQILGNL